MIFLSFLRTRDGEIFDDLLLGLEELFYLQALILAAYDGRQVSMGVLVQRATVDHRFQASSPCFRITASDIGVDAIGIDEVSRRHDA